jgi:hypothetical protein
MAAVSHNVGVSAAVAFAVVACSIDVQGTGTAVGADASADAPGDARGGADGAEASGPASDARLDTGSDARPANCDADNDEHPAVACGGNDCCDNDARVQPGTRAFFDAPSACGSFDYDCNGTAEREYGIANACNQAFACADPGFAADTACGVNAPFTTCEWLFGCYPNASTRTQRCR